MGWIIAAVGSLPEGVPQRALDEFRQIAAVFPAAPWKIETGHLRGGRERLEQITGRSWADIDFTAEDVRGEYQKLIADSELRERNGLTAALVAFLEVCSRHQLGLAGGEGARSLRPAQPAASGR